MSGEIINQIPDDIEILDIAVINSKLFTSEKYLKKRIKPFALDIEMGKKIGFNFEKELAKCFLNFDVKAIDKANKPLGMTFQIGIEFHFKITKLSKYLVDVGSKPQVNIQLGTNILAIAVSSARGIILERTNNTFFKGIIIPVINASKFLLEDSNSFINSEKE